MTRQCPDDSVLDVPLCFPLKSVESVEILEERSDVDVRSSSEKHMNAGDRDTGGNTSINSSAYDEMRRRGYLD